MSKKEVKKEYWRWPEYRRTLPGKDPKKAKIITAGVDVGSVSSKTMIMLDGEPYAWALMRTGSSSADSAVKITNWALEGTGLALKDFQYVVGTGYGRVNVTFANKAITEIACHAKGANYLWGPTVRTVLDVGGQDMGAIRTDDKGRVVSFQMNDKCAAGTGRGMEVFADLLSVQIEDFGETSLKVENDPPPVSSTCVTRTKSEGMELLRQGWSREKVLAAFCAAMAQRMFKLLDKVSIEREFVITGGQSKNVGTVSRLEKLIGFKRLPPPDWKGGGLDATLAGAIGAALFSKALYKKEHPQK